MSPCSLARRNIPDPHLSIRHTRGILRVYWQYVASIEQWHTASTTGSMNDQYQTLKYCQLVLAVSPELTAVLRTAQCSISSSE